MRRTLQQLWTRTDGAVAPTVALSLIGLIAVGGIAFDYARMASLDTELQSAADQAALAAASQLDGESGACTRAVAAAQSLVTNDARFANDAGGLAVTIANTSVCTNAGTPDDTVITDDPASSVRFFQDKGATTPATTVVNAHFVEVTVNSRRANYALTPIVGAMNSGDEKASARAGLGTALCKVPPLMMCDPNPGAETDWDAMKGRGLRLVSNSGPNWAPGAFGYIGPQDANSTQKALAYENPVFDCQGINESEEVSTGAPTPAITAINTRFDIYSISGGAGNVLTPCLGSSCPPAANVTKDLVLPAGGSCAIGKDWQLPPNRFSPRAYQATDTAMTSIDSDGKIDAMGLPRDDCHYTSYNSPCAGGRLGDGKWARGDYFNKYHAGDIPANASTMTRYETYRWEIDNSKIPNHLAGGSLTSGKKTTALYQEGKAVCNATVPDPSRDRRVVQVAVGENCAALHGASTPVQIGTWIQAFLVEPGLGSPGRGNGDSGNEIYLEIIGKVNPGGSAAQIVRRDVPYLVR